ACGIGSNRSEVKHAPLFFREAIERAAWHVRQGHAIVLVTGTLEPLAREATIALALQLILRQVSVSLAFLATRLEAHRGAWTGRIVGEPVFGEEKACAVRRLARERSFDLERCFA